ncbi:uncharacterized protein EV420DRAFT_1639726 [Desarmillaria tabescens]|uniref:Uncharacterized protein n=1 Tax=Armillaria tabescens TaxID=1929756 RepID=A0AA39NBC5_ARMTA|nr:uncharacterized protein EV420DRAFT_1639726 [Desarmillaria tabescens]KAK0462511.1 hypothetical protein EV420DRAFT_1639726 [Desarmillaria tabescens]
MALLLSFIVAAQDDHYAALNNKQGQTPCELVEEMERCSLPRAVRRDTAGSVLGGRGTSPPQHIRSVEPSPSRCTCTNVFFNIWSACLMSQGNYSLTSDQWLNQCEQQQLRVSTFKRSVGHQDHVPVWAYAEMPINKTFNIRQAGADSGDSEDQGGGWSKYQIITIVAISCSVVGVAAILLFLFRWRNLWARHHGVSLKGFSFKFPRFPHGPKKVRSDSRDNDWAIDGEVEALEDFEVVPTPSTSRHGHIRLSSYPTPYNGPMYGGPMRRTWYIRSQDFFRKTGQKLLDIAESIPLPWKTKPVHVGKLSRGMVFDIDGTAISTKTDSTLENYRTAGKQVFTAQVVPGSSGFPRSNGNILPLEDTESFISNNGEDQPGFEADSEQERLITPSEEFPDPPPSVMLISRGGNDFTLESGESRSQQQHAQEVHAPVASSSRPPEVPPDVKHQPILRPPPAPTYPAPLPPLSPPRGLPQRLRKPSSDNMLGLHTGPPPSRDGGAYPTPMASSSHLPIRTPSPLFIHRPSVESLQNASTSHFRIPSDPTTHSAIPSSNYSDENLPMISSPPYHASPLRDERILTPPPPNTPPPPLTPPQLMSTPMSIRPLPLPESSLHPLARTHQRNLSSESIIPARTDPVMLFSGPVRAAGYMASTDSLGRSSAASPDLYR